MIDESRQSIPALLHTPLAVWVHFPIPYRYRIPASVIATLTRRAAELPYFCDLLSSHSHRRNLLNFEARREGIFCHEFSPFFVDGLNIGGTDQEHKSTKAAQEYYVERESSFVSTGGISLAARSVSLRPKTLKDTPIPLFAFCSASGWPWSAPTRSDHTGARPSAVASVRLAMRR